MEGLTTIHLGGKLGQLFGKRWDLMVNSPAEAIRAIDINLKGKLRAYLSKEGAKKFYKIGIGKKESLIDRAEVNNRSGKSDIYVFPSAKGKNSGVGKLFAAAVLVVISLTPVGAAINAATGGSLWMAAASLAIGGVTQLLTPAPNFHNNPEGESRGSNLFGGNAAAITQGGAVGLVYGRALVTPMPVSISFDNKDQILPTVDIGGFCTEDNGNGLQTYSPSDGGPCPTT